MLFNGIAVPAGTYRIYAVPGVNEFEISLNTELGKWGAFEPNYDLDILKNSVPVVKDNESIEQFTTRFEEEGDKVIVVFEWSDTKIKIPLEAK